MTEFPAAPTNTAKPQILSGLIKAHGLAALVTLLISAFFGLLVSIKMHHPDFAGNDSWLTWGRLRYNHTQGIFFGWLGNAFLMFLYYAVPKLSLRSVTNKQLGWCLFALWNFAVVLPGWLLVLAGFSQPLEWGEFPLIVDAFVVVAFIMMIVQFAFPLLKGKLSHLYVSGWYIIGSLFFTALAYPVGNIAPQLLPGAQGAAFSGLWIHDAIGLYVTPLAVAIAYFVIPVATRRPINSHFLSMIGFWILFFTYPLNGTHHYIFSAIPMDAQSGAIAASVYLGLDVVLVVTNLLLSLRGSGESIKNDVSLRFVWMGVILYLIVSLQGSLQALMPLNKLVHFSDWVIGHSHLAMLGFASFIAVGGMSHVWQRIPGLRFNARALTWCYWLMLSGMVTMVAVLTLAGLVESHLWQSSLPWLDSVRTVKHYWVARTFAAIPVLAGFVCLWISLTSGPVTSDENAEKAGGLSFEQPTFRDAASVAATPAASSATSTDKSVTGDGGAKWLNMAYLSASLAGFGFFIFSFAVLGIIPGMALEKEVARTKPAVMLPPTPQQQAGRIVYAREGCAYCHTQQVRVVTSDVQRFGAPTKAWETQYEYPQLWGTRRVGPDLARESGIRSDDWQLTHLYNPRLVVADSMMPGYPWLFDGSAAKPSKDAADLLQYVKSLGHARQLAGNGADQFTLAVNCACPDDVKKLETEQTAIDASASMPRRSHSGLAVELPTDPTQLATDARRGQKIYAQNCATCHGATGGGDGVAAATLLPKPADLTASKISVAGLSSIIMNGMPGTAMPAWRDMPQRDVEGLIAYLTTLPKAETPVEVSAADLESGKRLFAQQCVSCHGTTGNGSGPASGNLARCPTNFIEEQPSTQDAMNALENGVAGTSMPPWRLQLSEEERRQLTAYVRTLYRGM
ncbi:MAG: cbb3-type cytochrome c oxidase subunit I [Cyanobacteria bacterium SZAS-4]|nr:cbb3-type cytochrome c oxidase subunit I [Cyanobacteria bacterium SZAS-4]